VAGQIILKRLPEIDGRWYHDLRPITKQLAADQPLAAVLLYRKMAKAVLNEVRRSTTPTRRRMCSQRVRLQRR
jgi:hypothetical protein